MKWVHTKIFIFFIVICILITSGCVSQNQTRNTSGISANATMPTLVQTLCPPIPANVTPYIIINPIGDHRVGDFEINGTTNLAANHSIIFGVYAAAFKPGLGSRRPFTSLWENITVQGDNCGVNRWSFLVNTSSFNLDEYAVNVTSENPSVTNHSLFILYESSFVFDKKTITTSPTT
jgi:hypothetical protein